MATIEIYKNYGCLAAEKRAIYTFGGKASTAVCADLLTVQVPDGWTLYKNHMDQIMIHSPWGWDYDINQLLAGDEYPIFDVYDKDYRRHVQRLVVVDTVEC